MRKRYVYRISADGLRISGLWSDALALLDGDKNVVRASEVEFIDNKWRVTILGEFPFCLIASFNKRGDALDAERDYLNALIAASSVVGLSPFRYYREEEHTEKENYGDEANGCCEAGYFADSLDS